MIDKRTGRPAGDHGSTDEALRFALDVQADTLQTYEFLKAWREGNLKDWPEFYIWLKESDNA